ncbi:hypothetical protein CHUAL_000487 [Chamberlinius hualienensis]
MRKKSSDKPLEENRSNRKELLNVKPNRNKNAQQPGKSTFENLVGFRLQQLGNWNSFVQLMCRPCDPALLGFTRIAFGIVMTLDTLNERGFAQIIQRIDGKMCFYPLFDFIQPFQDKVWWTLLFFVMTLGAVGMTIGLFYRLSCLAFVIPYWYRYLLVTESWNNHSYLFGLLGILFLFVDAHHYKSLDTIYRHKIRNAHVPLWNYALLRFQIFVVYFIAGIKKTDLDWLSGYSQHYLAQHWIFTPFKFVLNEAFIDHVIVHIMGFLLDLTICFFLYFDYTRPFAIFFGMFPYAMLATITIFCYPDWGRRPIESIKEFVKTRLYYKNKNVGQPNYSANLLLAPSTRGLKRHHHCLYPDAKKSNKKFHVGKSYHVICILLLSHVAIQGFLPFSHFITKGYNHWRDGLYGYSWDMMVHSETTLFRRISAHFPHNGSTHLISDLNLSTRNRWSQYARQAKQMAKCLESRLREIDPTFDKVQIYLEVWKSLNERIQQRFFDSRVDILTAEWSPFQQSEWVLPLLNDSEIWRNRVNEISDQYNASVGVVATFMSDFPGFTLTKCLQPEMVNATVEILEGEVVVEINGLPNVSLTTGKTAPLTSGKFFKLHVVSSVPASYFIVATNITFKSNIENVEVEPTLYDIESEVLNGITCESEDMNYDFAFEGDLNREHEEIAAKNQNVTVFDYIYQIIKSHIDSAVYNYKETKHAFIILASRFF